MSSIHSVAARSPVFQSLSSDDIEGLFHRASARNLDRGASIFLQGEQAHSLFVTIDGWIKTYRVSSVGSEAVVGIVTTSGSFGEEAALPGAQYSVGAEAVSNALVLQIDSTTLNSAIERDLGVCQSILCGALEQNRSLVHHVEQLKSHTGAQRIADFLLNLCGAETGHCTVVLPYDKVLIAAWLGMKPESLSRAFRRLKSYGVTIRKNHAVIESVEALGHYAEEDRAEAWSMSS